MAGHTATPGARFDLSSAATTRFIFCASTGRTATMFLATCLNRLTDVVGLHEGHLPGERPLPRLPLINVHNRRAWHDPKYAARLVAEMRDVATLSAAAKQARMLVDVAFYNAPLLTAIAERHSDASLFVIFRRCEGFVRSATVISGEDLQPAGWPDRAKPLTEREKFISLGRLKPRTGHEDHVSWSDWSAIQRNIWLWTTVNKHLHRFADANTNCHRLFFENLVEGPDAFWTDFLQKLGLFSPSTLSKCIEFSRSKVNQRQSYQIGSISSWNAKEQEFYLERACPLENEIYD